jgi:hypothetical protein
MDSSGEADEESIPNRVRKKSGFVVASPTPHEMRGASPPLPEDQLTMTSNLFFRTLRMVISISWVIMIANPRRT